MKNILFILVIILFVGFITGCKDDFVGQPPTDSQAPAPVRNPVAVSIPGGAKITYELPDNNDLLYVKAVYVINGTERNTSASFSSKVLEIKGFGTTESQTVSLYSVDRSGNMSEPVKVSITPGTSPIRIISESIRMKETFGGIQITWENASKENVALYIVEMGKDGDMDELDIAFSNAENGKYSVRGLGSIERVFGVYVRDRWDNISETRTATLTPLAEYKLDKSLWQRRIIPGDNPTNSGFGPWSHIKDEIWETDNIWETLTSMIPILFTIDLGVTTKLSRYTLWQRNAGYQYKNSNPKRWKIYGTDILKGSESDDYWKTVEEDAGWKKDWILLGDGETFKPSGDGPVTQEDLEYALQGYSFDMSIDAPPIRYVRFHVTDIWETIGLLHISELSFWGASAEE
ncbi:MAG: DUF4959 domain-containing protein [Tannerellaceae bacterium]|jgi:hypothetical protein|nr:DUF4959 domain-containing protein [Tannerellaceae bacterium]